MNNADIVTGQFVRIQQAPASIGDRIVERLVDMAVLYGYIIGMVYLSSLLPLHGNMEATFWIILVAVPAIGYSLICELFFQGRTLGKYIRKTRVVMADGSAPTAGALAIRWMLEAVDIWMVAIGLVFIVCSRRHQRLGDMAAGTMVVKDTLDTLPSLQLGELDYIQRDYRPTYPEAERLTIGQAETIRKTLERTEDSQTARLAEKVRHVLGYTREAVKQSDYAFLRTVLHDYRYYSLQLV